MSFKSLNVASYMSFPAVAAIAAVMLFAMLA